MAVLPFCINAQNKNTSIWFPEGEGMSTYVIDYKYLTNKGFYISESNSVTFAYTPIGHVEIKAKRYFSEVKKGDPDYEKYGALSIENSNQVKNGHPIKTYDFPSIYKIFDQIYEKGKSLGANGLINFKIDYKYDSTDLLPSQIFVSGMFIKK